MPLILPGNVASATAPTTFSAANSCRFNKGDSPYMHKTPGSNGSARKFTISAWVKRGNLSGAVDNIIWSSVEDSSNYVQLALNDADRLEFRSKTSGSYVMRKATNRLFRDCSSFYHIVAAVDTEQGTAANRNRLYVNGVEYTTSWDTDTNVAEDADLKVNQTGTVKNISKSDHYYGANPYFDGYMAEVVFIDGTQYAASDFGEYDEDSPTIWKPKDVSELTFGTNGFYLDFEDSSNLGNDANGGTDLTEVNLAATDQATDTPTNNFCTMNPLDNEYPNYAFSEGNLGIVTPTDTSTFNTGTIGLTAGKWYWEIKFITNNTSRARFGITSKTSLSTSDNLGDTAEAYTYYSNNGNKINNDTSASYGDSYTANDIISVALDLDNLKVYFAKNGTWQDSGDPTTGATGTGAAYTVTAVASTTAGAYFPAVGEDGGEVDTYNLNFGNPPYANSSDAADGNGYGAFEYAPPSGYLALCTKNLGSDGG